MIKTITTKLTPESILPLTCSRKGTCCHGNQVILNPWELFWIANEKKVSPKEFQKQYCDSGGIRLAFNGKKDARGKLACSQYIEGFGCSVHHNRPLACRLFPLGRQVQNNKVEYVHQGKTFPCLNGCKEVIDLPKLSVKQYVKEQKTANHEIAEDLYLDIMQNLADIAFEFLLDYGLAESGDVKTLALWRIMSVESTDKLSKRIGQEWMGYIMTPQINEHNPTLFAQLHNELLQLKIQDNFGALNTNDGFHQASVFIMGITILLAKTVGADTASLVDFWIETAKSHGAKS